MASTCSRCRGVDDARSASLCTCRHSNARNTWVTPGIRAADPDPEHEQRRRPSERLHGPEGDCDRRDPRRATAATTAPTGSPTSRRSRRSRGESDTRRRAGRARRRSPRPPESGDPARQEDDPEQCVRGLPRRCDRGQVNSVPATRTRQSTTPVRIAIDPTEVRLNCRMASDSSIHAQPLTSRSHQYLVAPARLVAKRDPRCAASSQ